MLVAISHNNPFDTHVAMSSAKAFNRWQTKRALSLVILLVMTPLLNLADPSEITIFSDSHNSSYTAENPWNPQSQPWAQYSGVPTHNGTMPAHSPSGGPGLGDVANVTTFGIIDSPTVNWVALEDLDGADTYGSVIGDFSASVTSTPAAVERCGLGELFAVIISSDSGSSTMSIVTGDDAKTAWEVDLGQTQTIRSTPMITDINGDDKQEIILAYDTDSSLEIEVWSPALTCSESGWVKSGHANEKLWSFSDADYTLGIDSPHFPTTQSNHKSITQPLLADLDLDGDAELVLSVVDKGSNDPTVTALTLTTSSPNDFDWEVVLDKGTHPSDPAWGMLDDDSTAVVLTTIDANSGNMWLWRIDGESGSIELGPVSLSGTDSDSDSPRLRLPGPVIVQLDADDAPEMILTIPTDANGRTNGNGARFVAMEMTSTDEIWQFRTPNGYSDSQPLPIDTTNDGIHDRLCWVTWYSESTVTFNRKGMAGCHDISADPPIKEWSKDMQRGSGNDNDEIGVSPPIWMDINDDDYPELIVPYGKRLWAFDGEDGTSSEVSDGWSSPLGMPKRVWSAPAVADMDNDGTLDILIGDTLISQNVADFAPLSDNRGISFNPSQPDPGDTVTVTGQFSNTGTLDNEDDLDVVLKQNGNEIIRQRFTDVEPISPSGNGGPHTFSVDIIAELGIHNFEMILDVNGNLSEARKDNNYAQINLLVVEPYAAQIDIPSVVPRISPGGSEEVTVSLLATGSRTDNWILDWDDSNLPNGWTFNPAANQDLNANLVPGVAQEFDFIATIPQSALGDDNSFVTLSLTLDSDAGISFSTILPIEVLRTRGLSIVGPSGLDNTSGFGRPGDTATAWMMVENLGNAYETSTSIDWTAPSWGGTPSLVDLNGVEIFSINLAPNEQKELLVNLATPNSIQPGSITTTKMTMCIGSGDDTLCEEFNINLTASLVTVTQIHQRTLPNSSLQWSVQGAIPSDGSMIWNTVAANMVHTNWVWSVDGDLSFNGNNIEANGNSGEAFTGNIYLDLPVNAVPQRHYFTTNSQSDNYHDLFFTMQVMQVYRSAATIVQPTQSVNGEPISMIVETTNQVLLRLENPGNGEDDFLLSSEVIAGMGMSAPPVVDLIEYNPQRTLGALASTIATVDVTLSADTPAQEPFILRFSWESLGGQNIISIVDLLVEAEPDHRWNVTLTDGDAYSILPSETLSLDYTVKNTGNAQDNLVVIPTIIMEYHSGDDSIWVTDSNTYPNIEINQTVSLNINITAPGDAWNGTKAIVTLNLYSDELFVTNTSLTIEIKQISGWRLNLSDTNLVIEPEGQNLTLNVEHLGNLARQPWYAKAGEGWNISVPQNGAVVEPFGNTTVTIFVTPPEYSVAGEVGVLRLRVSDGDGSGQTIQEVPVRVGASPSIDLNAKGDWLLNSTLGGMPTAWVENNGNDLATLSLSVTGIPNGWAVDYPDKLIIAPNQIIGLPITLTPHSSWDNTSISVNVEVTHNIIGSQSISIPVIASDFAFTSSPVISGVVGNTATVTVTNKHVSGPSYVEILDSELTVSLQSSKQNITLISVDGETEFYIHSFGYMLPQFSANCNFIPSAMSDLGRTSLAGKIASCTLTAPPEEKFTGTVVLLTSDGNSVLLDSNTFYVAKDSSLLFDVNTTNWKPDAGDLMLTLMIVDSYGREITQKQISVTARAGGWNIGIDDFSADGDLRIAILRTSYQRLEGTTCTIKLDSPDNTWSKTMIIDIAGYNTAPIINIDDPGTLKDDDLIRAELRCSSPYDIDDIAADDTAETYYNKQNSDIIENSEFMFGILTIIVVLTIAYFTGFLTTNKTRVAKPKQSSQQVNDADENDDVVEDEPPPEGDDLDDFSIEFEDDNSEEVIEIPDEEITESNPQEIIDDSTASGRLASLREEILTDERPVDTRPLSDRMADFFND
mgnify:FL=1|tara:strand:+ start:9748 stop:15501 length:5754 start_codon:yes stop_codon:yes gene_type:complete